MSSEVDSTRTIPSRKQAVLFQGKTALLKIRRAVSDLRQPVARQQRGRNHHAAPVVSEASAEIWNHQSEVEFPLTAGKVQNLRIACQSLHGLEVPAGAVFSFWKQVGEGFLSSADRSFLMLTHIPQVELTELLQFVDIDPIHTGIQ